MLYLKSNVKTIEHAAAELESRLKLLNITVTCVTNSTSVQRFDFKVPQVIVTTPIVWELVTQGKYFSFVLF